MTTPDLPQSSGAEPSAATLGPRALTHGQREVRDVRTMFEASYRRLVAQMYGVCGDLTEAEDAVQEGFAKALAHESTFQRLDNPEAWLRTVSLNHLRSRWRRVRRHALLQHKLTEPALSVPDLSADHVALVAALRQLPTAQREVIALHHLGDLPVAEVARALGVPAGTVKARLSRGRAALAQLLDDPSSEAGTPHA